MVKRLCVLACAVALGLSLSGCTKCGWIWDDGPPKSCHGTAP